VGIGATVLINTASLQGWLRAGAVQPRSVRAGRVTRLGWHKVRIPDGHSAEPVAQPLRRGGEGLIARYNERVRFREAGRD